MTISSFKANNSIILFSQITLKSGEFILILPIILIAKHYNKIINKEKKIYTRFY